MTPPYAPGGTDINEAPLPLAPGHLVVPDGDGYVEFDEDGTPLGRWTWDPDEGEWVFEEIPPPLALLPYTGVAGNTGAFLALTLLAILALLLVIVRVKQVKSKRG